jgi:glycogen(starch) synthase
MIDRLSSLKRTVSILKREFSPDLIHLSTLNLSHFFHLETRQAHSSPVVVTLHGFENPSEPVHSNHSTLKERVLDSANWVTGVSHGLMDQARLMAPGIIPRSSVIHNGLDLPPVLPKPLPVDPPILLYLGRLSKEKGVDRALAILPSIVERCPSIRLLVAGDGPERLFLEKQASNLGIKKHVEFLGMIPAEDVPPLLNKATIVLMPSRMESFGFVALEAALMARPVVATRVGGLSEIIIHSKTGLLVTNEDSQELCHAVTYLLGHHQIAEQMGQAARQRAIENFSLHGCVDAYDLLYQKIRNEFAAPKTRNLLKVHT